MSWTDLLDRTLAVASARWALVSSFAVAFASWLLLAGLAPGMVGGPLLDLYFMPDAAAARLAEMSIDLRFGHAALTLVVDSMFPIAYGFLALGVIGRIGPRARGLAWLPVLLVGFDFAENFFQIVALAGFPAALAPKMLITPIKFAGAIYTVLMIAAYYLWAKLEGFEWPEP